MHSQLTPIAHSVTAQDAHVTKTCKDCGQTLPATREYFYGRPTARDGLRTCCKTCYNTRCNVKVWSICQHCGTDFYGGRDRRFCSRACCTLGTPSRRITRQCRLCGKEYNGSKQKVYCSMECRKAVHRPSWNAGRGGYEVPQRRTGQHKVCVRCGKTFYTVAGRPQAKYCSRMCYVAGRWSGSRQVTKTCPICGTSFTSKLSERRRTCSWECRAQWCGERQMGEKSHFWRGGRVAVYTREWRPARAGAMERDGYACALCGATERLNVHHIVPFRYSHSHQIENLVTLCRSCHSREECKVNPAFVAALAEGRRLRTQT